VWLRPDPVTIVPSVALLLIIASGWALVAHLPLPIPEACFVAYLWLTAISWRQMLARSVMEEPGGTPVVGYINTFLYRFIAPIGLAVNVIWAIESFSGKELSDQYVNFILLMSFCVSFFVLLVVDNWWTETESRAWTKKKR
jgi:hypothetical protein